MHAQTDNADTKRNSSNVNLLELYTHQLSLIDSQRTEDSLRHTEMIAQLNSLKTTDKLQKYNTIPSGYLPYDYKVPGFNINLDKDNRKPQMSFFGQRTQLTNRRQRANNIFTNVVSCYLLSLHVILLG